MKNVGNISYIQNEAKQQVGNISYIQNEAKQQLLVAKLILVQIQDKAIRWNMSMQIMQISKFQNACIY